MTTPENAEPALIAPGEFPVWLPSMFVKELRQALRAQGFIASFAVFQVAMGVLMLSTLAVGLSTGADNARGMTQLADLDGLFWLIVAALLLGVIPLGGLIGLRSEIESRRIDLLVLTRLTSWRIVLGKWGSLMAQATLSVIAMLPYGLVRYFNGTLDLATDFNRCLLLVVGCAVLSAAAIWASSFGRILGLVLAVPVVAAQVGAAILMFNLTASGAGSRNLLASGVVLPVALSGILVLLFCLVSAVRQIAPPAEDYTVVARGLGLFSMVPVAFAAMRPGPAPAKLFSVAFALSFAAVVCLIELANPRRPMAVHCRNYFKLGRLRSLLAPFVLPGWETALPYSLLLALVLMTSIATSPFLSGPVFDDIGWMIFQVLTAVAFPAVLASLFVGYFPGSSRYFLVFAGLALVAGLAILVGELLGDQAIVDVVSLLPVAGLLLAFDRNNFGRGGDDFEFLFPFAVFFCTFVVGLLRSRAYWHRVSELGEKPHGREPK